MAFYVQCVIFAVSRSLKTRVCFHCQRKRNRQRMTKGNTRYLPTLDIYAFLQDMWINNRVFGAFRKLGLSHYFEGHCKETLKESEIRSCVQAEILFCDDMISEEIFLRVTRKELSLLLRWPPSGFHYHPHISFLTVRENLVEKIQ